MNDPGLPNQQATRADGGVLRFIAFPLIMAAVIAAAWLTYAPGREGVLTPSIFLAVLGAVVLLERQFPFEPGWNGSWRDNRQDGAFFLLAQPFVALAEVAALTLGTVLALKLAGAMDPSWWPTRWPAIVQIVLALIISDFLPYWYHRISHETGGWLWRVHAIHHAPSRLYSLNFVRFHPVNSFTSSFLMLLPLIALGVPAQIVFVVAMISKTHSLLSHTNFDFRLGPLNWAFSMAELHRWHHARDIRQANANYGATLILWDAVFGTRKLPAEDVRKHDLGISNPAAVPAGLCDQLCRLKLV